MNLKTKLVLRLAKREDQALISISTILKFKYYKKKGPNKQNTKYTYKYILGNRFDFETFNIM